MIHSLDVHALEDVLLERIARRPCGGLRRGVLVLVPTRRLVLHLKRRIAARFEAVLGVHVLTHQALAVRALECALEPPPRLLCATLGTTLVGELVRGDPGEDAEYLKDHAGARGAVAATFRELREARVEPAELARAMDLPGGMEGSVPFIASLYERYTEALARLQRRGLADRAALVTAALPHVASFLRLKGIEEVLHHGAYELVGVHLELLEAAAAQADTTLLFPSRVEGESFRYAARFAAAIQARGWTIEAAGPESSAERSSWMDRVATLGEPLDAPPREPYAGRPALELQHAQGPAAELRAAALRALAIHERDGTALEDMAIVARSLAPYKPFLPDTFESLGIPWSSSATAPLARDPYVAAFLALAGVLAGDLERRKVIDLLRRPSLCLAGPPGDAAVDDRDLDRWERWSLVARIDSGIDSWRELAGWVEYQEIPDAASAVQEEIRRERRESAGRLLRILEVLEEERRAWCEAGDLPAHAAFLRRLASRFLALEEAPAEAGALIERVLRAVEDAAEVIDAAVAGSAAAPSPGDVERLARAVAESEEIALDGGSQGGIQVLDVMQARGLRHAGVIWIGFHDGSFPRKARPDPYLPDAVREQLRRRSGKLLPSKRRAPEEERLLLSMMLASAGERVVVSLQRADERGRRKARSSALRDLARVFSGKPDARALLEDGAGGPMRPERISAHPRVRALELASSPRFGLLPPSEALTSAVAGAAHGPAMGRAAVSALGADAGLDQAGALACLGCVEAIERFEPPLGAYDGVTGMGIGADEPFSPTALQLLACCPLSFFLRNVLGLRKLDEEVASHRIEDQVLGLAVHATLAAVYGKLEAQGLLRESGASAETEALDLLGRFWSRELERAAGTARRRLQVLFDLLDARWRSSLEEFVRQDLGELPLDAQTRLEVEKHVDARLPLPGGRRVRVEGRIDRLVSSEGGVWIDDYKTGASDPAKKLQPAEILHGFSLQLPLYREVVASLSGVRPESIRGRLLGVGPKASKRVAVLPLSDDLREGFLETVGVAVDLAREGRFPLYPSAPMGYCSYCGYRKTCRRHHEPTLARLEASRSLADFRDVRKKRAKGGKHLLAGMRGDGGKGGRKS